MTPTSVVVGSHMTGLVFRMVSDCRCDAGDVTNNDWYVELYIDNE